MKVLNIGSCNLDYVYSLDHIVAEGETERSFDMRIFPGGKGLNQSVAAAKAGAKIYHAACVGSDGDMLIDIMNKSGVDTSLIMRRDAKNGHAIIQVSSSAENSIFVYPGTNDMIDKDYIDRTLALFSKGDILILQNEISNPVYIIEQAYKKEMTIILNPSPINANLFEIDMNMISYLVLNEIEIKSFFASANADASLLIAAENYPNLKIVLTKGVKGSVYKDSENYIYQPSFKAQAVDTTAAGDTFMGYFVAGLYNEMPIGEILKTASAASAITVSRNGASPSIPYADEVYSRLGEMEENVIAPDNDVFLKALDEYIMNNLTDTRLKDFAEHMKCSCGSARSAVKKHTGKNFNEYVRVLKIKFCAKLLGETDMNISEIIKLTGYENESYFRRKFKEVYGLSPNRYRKTERAQQ